MKDKIEFEQLNLGWNAEPNAPEVEITVLGNDVIVVFFLNAFLYDEFNEGDKAKLTFHDCMQYRCGNPNDEGFYIYGQSRFKSFGVKWGEFYLVRGSNWKEEFPDLIFVSNQPHDRLNHYLFYFKDETFECIAKNFDLQIETKQTNSVLSNYPLREEHPFSKGFLTYRSI